MKLFPAACACFFPGLMLQQNLKAWGFKGMDQALPAFHKSLHHTSGPHDSFLAVLKFHVLSIGVLC